MICIESFSSYEKLIASTSYVLLFVEQLKVKLKRNTKGEELQESALRVSKLEQYRSKAEVLWIQEVQSNGLREEWKTQFMMFLDKSGVSRCGGRLSNANLSYDARYPILLPRDHFLTWLIIRRAHQRIGHSGMKATLTEIRSRFWIPQGRSLIWKYINQCVVCRRHDAPSYKPPPPPPLPKYRVPPFTAIGVDFAGPLMIRQNPYISHTHNNVTESTNTLSPCRGKAWVCLFTCCVSRAVHFEIVVDLPVFLGVLSDLYQDVGCHQELFLTMDRHSRLLRRR